MCVKSIICFFIILSFTSISCNISIEIDEKELFLDSLNNISCLYPKKWKVIKSEDANVLLIARIGDTSNFDTFNITLDSFPSTTTHLEHYNGELRKILKEYNSELILKSKNEYLINNYKCYESAFSIKDYFVKIHSIYVENRCYNITFVLNSNNRFISEKEILSILKSINLSIR